ncbi:MAG: glucosylceramidase [Sediminibacterium sp.]|nr:glucosylceramidase [Sediminibacterium sp.]
MIHPGKLICISFCLLTSAMAQTRRTVDVWLTDPAKQVFFAKQPPLDFGKAITSPVLINVDDSRQYQSIDGFGFALTGGSAQNIIKMDAASRSLLLKELFGTDGNHIGISYLRLSIGASDLNDHVFSYDDLPAGQTDTPLLHFDLGPDKQDVIPVLKEILAIAPGIKILGSPWSPPTWMKTNNDTRGGSLLPQYYNAYARYFVKYIEAMRKQGIRIDAVTVQNEPLHPGNNPSLLMLAPDQAVFVRDHLGPAFRKAKLATKIIIYDHNADKPEYPISILNDAGARKYIDGSAFHLYGGTIDALSKVHDAHPDKNLYFTEQWVGAPGNFPRDIKEHIEKLTIGATRNWSKTVIEWNLAADEHQDPHTDRGGCTSCLGAVTIEKNKVTRNPAYYSIAHASKVVRPGSVRIGSNVPTGLPNVAFRTPSGRIAVIVLNTGKAEQDFGIVYQGKTIAASLPPGASATYYW